MNLTATEYNSFARSSVDMDAIAAEAISRWDGLHTPSLISFRENIVFSARSQEGAVVVRIHRPGYQSDDAIRSELWYMSALAESGLPVPRPLPASDGSMYVRLSNSLIASTLTWLDGTLLHRHPHRVSGDADNLTTIYAGLGRTLARFHKASDSLALPEWFVRPRWHLDGLLGEQPLWGRFWEHGNLAPEEADIVLQARSLLKEELGELIASDAGLIHADVLQENVMCDGSGVALIDFDDCGFGFRCYDLGIVLISNIREPQLARLMAALLSGYSDIRALSTREVRLIDRFALTRALVSIGWTMTRLPESDPRNRDYIERALSVARTVLDNKMLY